MIKQDLSFGTSAEYILADPDSKHFTILTLNPKQTRSV